MAMLVQGTQLLALSRSLPAEAQPTAARLACFHISRGPQAYSFLSGCLEQPADPHPPHNSIGGAAQAQSRRGMAAQEVKQSLPFILRAALKVRGWSLTCTSSPECQVLSLVWGLLHVLLLGP